MLAGCFELAKIFRGEALRAHTNSSRLDHVADGEALDGLVLGGAAGAVAATDRVDVAAALLVAAAGVLLVNCKLKKQKLLGV